MIGVLTHKRRLARRASLLLCLSICASLAACASGVADPNDAAPDQGVSFQTDATLDMAAPPRPQPAQYPPPGDPFVVAPLGTQDHCPQDNDIPEGIALTPVATVDLTARYARDNTEQHATVFIKWHEEQFEGTIVLPAETGESTIRLQQIFWNRSDNGTGEGELDQEHATNEPRRAQGVCTFKEDAAQVGTRCSVRLHVDSSTLMHGLRMAVRSYAQDQRGKPFHERRLLFSLALPTACALDHSPSGLRRPLMQWYDHAAAQEMQRMFGEAAIWLHGGPFTRIAISGPWDDPSDHYVRTKYNALWQFTGVEPAPQENDSALHAVPPWHRFQHTLLPADLSVRYAP